MNDHSQLMLKWEDVTQNIGVFLLADASNLASEHCPCHGTLSQPERFIC